jgi:hypothetical protein
MLSFGRFGSVPSPVIRSIGELTFNFPLEIGKLTSSFASRWQVVLLLCRAKRR